jgi:hypothetical protein
MDNSSQKCGLELGLVIYYHEIFREYYYIISMQPGALVLASASQLHQKQFYENTNICKLVIKIKASTKLIVTELDEC